MTCPSCSKEISPDTYFCQWCCAFVPSPLTGTKEGVFARLVALMLDPLLAVVLYLLGIGLVGALTGSQDAGLAAAILLPIVYFVWFLALLRRGLTPGKKLLGLQVVT